MNGVGAVPLQVVPVPCLRDNYSYIVFSPGRDESCLIIDACEATPITSEVKKRGLRPLAILTTHHHRDHVGGNIELAERFSIPIYGHKSEMGRIPALSEIVNDDDTLSIGDFEIRTFHVPGHTQGAVVYWLPHICFTGDTLFCGSCGRLLEGTAQQLHHSLNQIVNRLPDDTQLYTGHEYTEANFNFAHSVFPTSAVKARLDEVRRLRARGVYCASSSMGEEKKTNLFLMCHLPSLQQAVWGLQWSQERDSLGPEQLAFHTFAELRRRKDRA